MIFRDGALLSQTLENRRGIMRWNGWRLKTVGHITLPRLQLPSPPAPVPRSARPTGIADDMSSTIAGARSHRSSRASHAFLLDRQTRLHTRIGNYSVFMWTVHVRQPLLLADLSPSAVSRWGPLCVNGMNAPLSPLIAEVKPRSREAGRQRRRARGRQSAEKSFVLPSSARTIGHGPPGQVPTAANTRTVRSTNNKSSCGKLPISIGERSGQLRTYVRPVVRRWPLAIMGVRLRVRHQSVWRARGTRHSTVLPELLRAIPRLPTEPARRHRS